MACRALDFGILGAHGNKLVEFVLAILAAIFVNGHLLLFPSIGLLLHKVFDLLRIDRPGLPVENTTLAVQQDEGGD